MKSDSAVQSILKSNLQSSHEQRSPALEPSALAQSPAQPLLKMLHNFPAQVREAVHLGTAASLAGLPHQPNGVLFCGMGGSAIGGDLMAALVRPHLSVPITVNREVSLPAWVSEETLVIASSYSGNTEETLSAVDQARSRGAWICAISSGGRLESLARQEKFPLLPLPPGLPPRMTLVYGMAAPLVMLHRAGLCPDHEDALTAASHWAGQWGAGCGATNPLAGNPAKQLALMLLDRMPVVIGAGGGIEVLARRWAGQFSENAKQLGFFSTLPEMAHNEVVGWLEGHPGPGASLTPVWLCEPDEPPLVTRQREWISRQLEALGVKQIHISAAGPSWLHRIFSLLLLGDYASLYLAVLRNQDPLPVRSIEEMKQQIKDREP